MYYKKFCPAEVMLQLTLLDCKRLAESHTIMLKHFFDYLQHSFAFQTTLGIVWIFASLDSSVFLDGSSISWIIDFISEMSLHITSRREYSFVTTSSLLSSCIVTDSSMETIEKEKQVSLLTNKYIDIVAEKSLPTGIYFT